MPYGCQRLFPTPPASLRRRAHSITIRSATSACFSDSSMPVCYFPNSEAHGRHTHDTLLFLRRLRKRQADYPPIEETTASIISPAAAVVKRLRRLIQHPVGQRGLFAPGASAYFLPPLHRRQLHCVSIHEATSGEVNLSGKGESVKATSPPLCKGSLRCAPLATKRLATHSRTSSPGKSPFRRLTLHSVVVASTPG